MIYLHSHVPKIETYKKGRVYDDHSSISLSILGFVKTAKDFVGKRVVESDSPHIQSLRKRPNAHPTKRENTQNRSFSHRTFLLSTEIW